MCPETTTTTIKILLVDDHEVVRLGLRSLLEEFPHISVTGEAGTVQSAISEAERLKPDVVLLDIRLPDGSGFDASREMQHVSPDSKVLVLTSYVDDGTIFEAISSGANGYLLKEIQTEDLIKAIEDVAGGKSILDPSVTGRVFSKIKREKDDSPDLKIALLSAQEKRVLSHVSQGLTNKEIAQAMKLSDKTVKNYLSNALDKLGLNRRTEAAVFYARYLEQ